MSGQVPPPSSWSSASQSSGPPIRNLDSRMNQPQSQSLPYDQPYRTQAGYPPYNNPRQEVTYNPQQVPAWSQPPTNPTRLASLYAVSASPQGQPTLTNYDSIDPSPQQAYLSSSAVPDRMRYIQSSTDSGFFLSPQMSSLQTTTNPHPPQMSNLFKIFCLVIDHKRTPQGHPFPISCSTGDTVGDLTKAVLNENPDLKRQVDARLLTLWRLKQPQRLKALRTMLKEGGISFSDDDPSSVVEELDPTGDLSSYFTSNDENPNPLPKNCVHVLVEVPTSGIISASIAAPILRRISAPSSMPPPFINMPPPSINPSGSTSGVVGTPDATEDQPTAEFLLNEEYGYFAYKLKNPLESYAMVTPLLLEQLKIPVPVDSFSQNEPNGPGPSLTKLVFNEDRKLAIQTEVIDPTRAYSNQQDRDKFTKRTIMLYLAGEVSLSLFNSSVTRLSQIYNIYVFYLLKPVAEARYYEVNCTINQHIDIQILGSLESMGGKLGKYSPMPDFAIHHIADEFPRLVVEVKSDNRSSDRCRMFLYCAFLIRLALHVFRKKCNSEGDFEYAITAVYVEENDIYFWEIRPGEKYREQDNMDLICLPIERISITEANDMNKFIDLLLKSANEIRTLPYLNPEYFSDYKEHMKSVDPLFFKPANQQNKRKAGDRTGASTSSLSSTNRKAKKPKQSRQGTTANTGGLPPQPPRGPPSGPPPSGPPPPPPGEGSGAGSKAGSSSRSTRQPRARQAAAGREGTVQEQTSSAKNDQKYCDLDVIISWIRRELSAQVKSGETMQPDRLWKIRATSGDYMVKVGDRNELNILKMLKDSDRHPHVMSSLGIVDQVRDAFVMPRGYNWEEFHQMNGFASHSFKSVIGFLSGVKFLHRLGIAHRDLKPQNLVFIYSEVQIIDFGCATTEEYVKKGGRVGTKGFMAPEVERGRSYDPKKADLFSAGEVVKDFALEVKDQNVVSHNLQGLSALLAKEDPSDRLNLLSFFYFYNRHCGRGGISESRINEIIGSFVAQEMSRSRIGLLK